MQDKNRKEKGNDAIEDIKSSIVNLTNVAKTVQSLSGRFALLDEFFKSLNSVGSQLQSGLYKIEKAVEKLENAKETTRLGEFWTTTHPEKLEGIMKPTRTLESVKDETKNRVGYHHLSYLNEMEHYNVRIDGIENIHWLTFNFLYHVAWHGGYVYGGIVRDFLVPVLVYGFSPEDVTFKDIDIWFSNNAEVEQFVDSLNEGAFSCKLSPYSYDIEEYGCGQSFKREKYNFSIDGVQLFYIDIMLSDDLPVNDFNVNLLMFKAKVQDFTS